MGIFFNMALHPVVNNQVVARIMRLLLPFGSHCFKGVNANI